MNLEPLIVGETPSSHPLTCEHIHVKGREEHEAIIKDASRCKQLGLDQTYETIVYLNRWGGWLGENNE